MKKFLTVVSIALLFIGSGCSTTKSGNSSGRSAKSQRHPVQTQMIRIETYPSGAKIKTPESQISTKSPGIISVNNQVSNLELALKLRGYKTSVVIPGKYDATRGYVYPEWINYNFLTETYDSGWPEQSSSTQNDPTIRAGEAQNMVNRDAPGQTALERTIVRWYFDSAPRGARIFWRIISSIPDQVKNTNELYLSSTPFEETRSFNILGLTYENSRDVTIEFKVSMPGYHDQVKRYNVRQAIDQQEMSGFFDLVPAQ